MENAPIGLGGLLSPLDYRDKIAAMAVPPPTSALTLPAVYDTILDKVMMQNQIPACVCHSVVDVGKYYFFLKTGKWIDFSPRFLDILCKRFDGQPLDGGTFPRLAFKLWTQFGCATQAMLPNNTMLPLSQYRDNTVLTPEVMAEASQYKIPGFIQVPLDLQGMRTHIYLYGAVSALFSVGNELWIPSWSIKDTDPLRTPQTIIGGHEMTPKGWTSPVLNKLRNEWSEEWANHGETQYDTKAWTPFIHEAWTVAEVPQDTKDFLANLPSQTNFHYNWNADMHFGEANNDIKFLQIALMIMKVLPPIAPAELGIYGPKTAAAVGTFQSMKNIVPGAPNSCGPKTRQALNAVFAL